MVTSGTEHNGRATQGFQTVAEALRSARRAQLAEQADRNRKNLRESERARFWFAARVALVCAAGCAVGLVPMAWALHTTDIEHARIAWIAGPVIGQAIVVIALLIGIEKWERDEW